MVRIIKGHRGDIRPTRWRSESPYGIWSRGFPFGRHLDVDLPIGGISQHGGMLEINAPDFPFPDSAQRYMPKT